LSLLRRLASTIGANYRRELGLTIDAGGGFVRAPAGSVLETLALGAA